MKSSKLVRLIVPALCALTLAVTVTASAEENPSKGKAPHGKKADADKNGVVSETEKAAAKTEHDQKKAETDAKMLEKYDANQNGKLDPEEREKMKADKKAQSEQKKAEKETRKGERDAKKAENNKKN